MLLEFVREAGVAGFDDASAERLVSAMNTAYPLAEIEPGEEAFTRLAEMVLPDEKDRALGLECSRLTNCWFA